MSALGKDDARQSATSKVSVVMPAYNAVSTLRESIDSVLMQTYRDIELLVIDDCSCDNTWALIEEAAAQDARIVPIRMASNGGVAAARNAGIEAATGRYVAFLDSDDRWLPDKLIQQVTWMKESGAKICYSAYRRVNQNGEILSTVPAPERIAYSDQIRRNYIGNLTGIYDRELGDVTVQAVGHEDYVLWLELIRRAGSAHRVPSAEPLADYLVRGGSLSSNKLRSARWQWNIYRNVLGFGRVRAARYFLGYAANALFRGR